MTHPLREGRGPAAPPQAFTVLHRSPGPEDGPRAASSRGTRAEHRKAGASSGFSLIEILITVTLMLVVMSSLLPMLVRNAELNKSQQLRVTAQANARACLSMVVQVLRSAGWNPKDATFNGIDLDPDPTGTDNYITVRADFDEDGSTTSTDETITIRHHNNTIEWRKTYDTSQPYAVLADSISNDANGDGTIEAMFTPDSTTDPTMITVKITAQSPEPDPRTGQYFRYTVTSDVSLRDSI